MSDSERGLFVPRPHEFQTAIGYREPAKSPPLVTRQTHTLLGFYYRGVINNPAPAREYLRDYTLHYLKAAEEGSIALYDRNGQLLKDVDLEVRECADHALVVMAYLPDRAKSPYLPKGFSRRGMLKAPETREEYLRRIRELKIGIWQVVAGEVEPHTTLEADPRLLRTFEFFEVGSELPIRLTSDEREQQQLNRERFNDLLGGINIGLQ